MSDETLEDPVDAKIYSEFSVNELKFTQGTKKLAFSISAIDDDTERTCSVPNANSLIVASNETSVATLTELPAGASNTFYGKGAGSDVTSGTGNTIIGPESKAGSATATSRIVINMEGKYNNCFHLPSQTIHLPNLQNNTFSKIIYFDPTTSTIAYGDQGVGDGGASTIADGSEVTPGLKFENETTTGFYRTTAGKFSIAIQSTERVRFDGNQVLGVSGASPTFSFIGAATSGLGYSSSALRFYNTDEKLSLGATINTFAKGLLVAHSVVDNRETYGGTTFQQVVSVGQDASNSTGNFRFGLGLDASGVNLNMNYLQTDQNVRLAYFRTSATATTQGSEVGQLSAYVKPSGGTATEVLRLSSSQISSLGILTFPYGLVGAPGLAFNSDLDTGIYGADGSLSFAIAGANALTLNATTLTSAKTFITPSGDSTNPSISFTGNTNVGLYATTNTMGVIAGGAARFSVASTNIDASVPLRVLHSGSAATPSIIFSSSDTNTGLYYIGSDSFGFSAGGTLRMTVSDYVYMATNFAANNGGTANAPAITFVNDYNTGIYSTVGNTIQMSTAGVERFNITTGGISCLLPSFHPDGAVNAPGISFNSDTNTGFHRVASDTIGIATGGVNRASISTTEITTTVPFRAATGTAGAPTYSFFTDNTSGIYPTGTGVGISASAGTGTLRVLSDGIYSDRIFVTNLGTALGGVTHHQYRTTGGVIRWGAGLQIDEGGSDTGSQWTLWSYTDAGAFKSANISISRATRDILLYGRIFVDDTLAAPQMTFLNDSNTGITRVGADQIAITAGGTNILTATNKKVTIDTASTLGSGEALLLVDITAASDASSRVFHYTIDGKDSGYIYKDGRVMFNNGKFITSLSASNGMYDYSLPGSEGLEFVVGNSQSVMTMITTSGTPWTYLSSGLSLYSSFTSTIVQIANENLSYTSATMVELQAARTASTVFNFLTAKSSWGGSNDFEFSLRGDGNAFADGSWSGGGADYAEYFESSDGKEIPIGTVVELLPNGKVQAAVEVKNSIIGVVRTKKPAQGSAVIGNAGQLRWSGKYITNEFDEYEMEPYIVWEWTDEKELDDKGKPKKHSYHSDRVPQGVVVPENKTVLQHPTFLRKKLNPNYNPNTKYEPRENRVEWHIIGLLGQVPVKKNQPIPANWIRINEGVVADRYYIR